MKTIAFYISDSGFGHMMRSLALIEEILEKTTYYVAVVCGETQNAYAKGILNLYSDRISFIEENTDAKSVFKTNSLQVDVEATASNAAAYLEKLDELTDRQVGLLQEKDIVLVVCDISILGIMTGKRLGIKTVGISNYTWYNRFEYLKMDSKITDQYRAIYNQLDYMYMYAYSDSMSGLDCQKEAVGFVSRKADMTNTGNLRKDYWPAVYLSVGQVAEKDSMNAEFPGGTLFASGMMDISGNARLVKLPPNAVNTVDYVKASAFAIIKGGWASVAECLVNKVPFGVVVAEKGEDEQLSSKLVADGFAFETSEEELLDFNIKDFNIKAAQVKESPFDNDVDKIVKKLLSQI